MPIDSWKKIPLDVNELCLDTTLRCGQTFRWIKTGDGVWSCGLNGRVLRLRQDNNFLYYCANFPNQLQSKSSKSAQYELITPEISTSRTIDLGKSDSTLNLIYDYFDLRKSGTHRYSRWSKIDRVFAQHASTLRGIRILRQDAWEALISFICSSNNNISRISQMVQTLCIHFGKRLGRADSTDIYDFPSATDLITVVNIEEKLRSLKFGYRAKFIVETAGIIVNEKGLHWLTSLRNPDFLSSCFNLDSQFPIQGRNGYLYARNQLLQLRGVGPKVADCVCLMGLGWSEAVPVDTHVWQIAIRDYKFEYGPTTNVQRTNVLAPIPRLQSDTLRKGQKVSATPKSLTLTVYSAIGNNFRSLWGLEAGWAHSILFTAELTVFSSNRLAVGYRIEQGNNNAKEVRSNSRRSSAGKSANLAERTHRLPVGKREQESSSPLSLPPSSPLSSPSSLSGKKIAAGSVANISITPFPLKRKHSSMTKGALNGMKL